MNLNNYFVLGVTGHRDFIRDDIVDELVEILFDCLKQRIKNKRVLLLSPLADGADQYIAKKFLEYKEKNSLNWSLAVPMPFEKNFYIQTIENKKNFEELLKKSIGSYIIKGKNFDMNDEKFKNRQYKKVGEFVACNSNILIALYDGKKINKEGGTSQIIEFKRKNLCNTPSLIYWIKVERKNSITCDKIEKPNINDKYMEFFEKEMKIDKSKLLRLGIEIVENKMLTGRKNEKGMEGIRKFDI
ncbi:hypothetical protein [Caminibacter pacificus]|uniref:Uncharacterized protein n=1 Tax=Caminibacter pacificus TaxID=1424653 RepID=A0AAJ4RD26_9BACT|nr:hypothetical protein [Caminibacter pacificus]QCI27626.1 hypothetical protein C6V80_01200 [Caminibacter pacificus]ROR40198.1 hypothetical protein EDC58_1186 [Caminibacter pacificus]